LKAFVLDAETRNIEVLPELTMLTRKGTYALSVQGRSFNPDKEHTWLDLPVPYPTPGSPIISDLDFIGLVNSLPKAHSGCRITWASAVRAQRAVPRSRG
jgi:hypothetical protein